MLRKSGFKNIEIVLPKLDTALDKIEFRLTRRKSGKRIGGNTFILFRFLFYILEEKISKITVLRKLFAQVSISQSHFKGNS